MRTFEVREEKFIGIVGGIGTVFFGLLLFFGIVDGLQSNDKEQILLCAVVGGILWFGGIFMLAAWLFRRVVVNQEGCFYRTSFGRRIDFTIWEIHKCVIKETASNNLYRLYNAEGKLLARFEDNMVDGLELLLFLTERGVLIETVKKNRLYAKSKKIFNKKKKLDQDRKIQFINSRWNNKQIRKMVKVFRVIKVINIISLVISLILFSNQIIFVLSIVTLLFWYAIYLITYPLMVGDIDEAGRVWRKKHVELPLFTIFFAMIFMMNCGEDINVITHIRFCIYNAIVTIVLFIPFMIVSLKKIQKIRAGNWICVLILIIGGVFSSSYGVQWVCTVKEPIQEKAKVIDVEIIENSRGGDYFLTVELGDGETEELSVLPKLYNKVEIGDAIVVNKEESIFAIKYYRAEP